MIGGEGGEKELLSDRGNVKKRSNLTKRKRKRKENGETDDREMEKKRSNLTIRKRKERIGRYLMIEERRRKGEHNREKGKKNQ